MLILHFALISALYLLCTLRLTRRGWRRVSNPFKLVLAMYVASAGASIFYSGDAAEFMSGINETPYILLYSILLLITLSPILLLNGYRLPDFVIANRRGVKAFYKISSVFIWFALLYQIPYAFQALALGAVDVRSALNMEKIGILPESWLTTVAVAVSSFYVVFTIMLFIAIKERMSRFIRVSMMAGSILYVISSLCFTARDGALFCVITLIFAFQLFRGSLATKDVKKIGRIIAIAGGVCLVAISTFSIQRFNAETGANDLTEGTLGYIGQQPYVFVETIVRQNEYYGFHLRMPLMSAVLAQPAREIERTLPYEWSFGTYLKDYYSMFGISSLLVLSAMTFLAFFIFILRRNKLHPVAALIGMGFFFQFFTSGLFFLKMGGWAGNQYALLILIFGFFCNFYFKGSRSKVLVVRRQHGEL